jgi:ribosomal protein S18 acetylase RimI-like enzyme
MSLFTSGWEIEPDAGDEQAYQALGSDRIWNGYSIADLDPPYRAYTRIAVARHPQHGLAACLILQHPAFASIIPFGTPAGLAAILPAVALPSAAYVLIRPEQLATLKNHYRFVAEPQEMLRMWVDAAGFRPPVPTLPVEQLGIADLETIDTFYTAYPASTFNADQLASAPFFGVREGGMLVAAAGVHVVAPRFGIAAVGNIFTLPAARGRGYGLHVTAAVVAHLLNSSCREVILNVAVDNPAARRLYARLGFQGHCHYYEGRIERDATIT